MADPGCVVVVGGTSGIGREVVRHFVSTGRDVVLTGLDPDNAAKVAAEFGHRARGLGFDLAEPERIATALAGVGPVDHLVLAAIHRDEAAVADYGIAGAVNLVTLKLVGYTEVIHTLLPQMSADSSIVVFGGQAKDRPYPGSVTVSTVNGGVVGMVHALAHELAPIRINGIHPGIVGDSPYWSVKPQPVLDAVRDRTPTGRLVAMQDIVHAVVFLLENRAVNGTNLNVNGGTLVR
jgi:NAD(P)-dependent dehydrogenase (short-subunit alcohol dehydrogenase family)